MRTSIPYRKLLSIATVVVIGVLIFGTQMVNLYFTYDYEQFARQMNLAGRQRMLSQRLAKYVLSPDSIPVDLILHDMTGWKRVHNGLINGDASLELKPVSEPGIIQQLNNATVHTEAITSAIDAYVAGDIDIAELRQQVHLHEDPFLKKMDLIVSSLEAEADSQSYQFKFILAVMAVVSLIILIGGFFWVFKPIYNKMIAQDAEIQEGLERLKSANKDLETTIGELAVANNELVTAEEEIRCSHEAQLIITEELESKIRLNDLYINQLSAAQETAGLGYWSNNKEGEEIEWSEQMYTIFGLPQHPDIKGPTQEEFHAMIHPDDVYIPTIKANEAVEVGKVRYQMRIIKNIDEIRYIDTVVKKNVGPLGELVGFFGVSRDITDEENARKALIEAKEIAEKTGRELRITKDMLEQTSIVAKVGGWKADLMKGTLHWTDITKEIHEVDEDFQPDLLSGINFYKEGEHREKVQRVVEQAIDHGKPFNVELQIISQKGNERWVRSIGHPEFIKGKCVGLYGTFQDITEEVNIRQALVEAKEFAENAARIKQEFLANISHEIRTPMNAILGFTRILLKSEHEAEQEEYLQSIYDSADTLLVVINDILDFSKIQSGKFTIEKVHFSMYKLLSSQRKLFSLKVDELSVNLIFDTDNRLPAAVQGDPTRINQILNNLISNAIKFTKKGHVKVTTKIVSQEGELYHLRIEVKDTGIGIAKDKQESIFNSFEQEKGNTSRIYGGTGLGLTIVKKLVELMDGTITVESEEGVGSAFIVHLSFDLGDESLISNEATQIDFLPMDILVGCRILLAEDNRNNQILAKKSLTEAKCEVDIASNGKEAVRMLQKKPYDLVLMDVQMPVMDGIEATKEIKNLPSPYSDIPIIAMTAHALKEEENLYRSIGMCEYISKPFKPQQLYGKLIDVKKGNTWITQTQSDPHSDDSKLKTNASDKVEIDEKAKAVNKKDTPKAPVSTEKIIDSWNLPPYDKLNYADLGTYFESDDEEFIRTMLEVFLEDAPEYLRQLEVAFLEKDLNSFKKVVHTLKSSIMFLGLHNLMQLIQEIENLETENIHEDVINKFYEYIYQNIDSAIQEIKLHI